jgi:hypothetical protein
VNEPSSDQDRYSDEEVRQRTKALARAVLSMPPKPQKDVPRKRAESKRKAGGRARRVKRPGASGIRGGTSKD